MMYLKVPPEMLLGSKYPKTKERHGQREKGKDEGSYGGGRGSQFASHGWMVSTRNNTRGEGIRKIGFDSREKEGELFLEREG